MEVTDWWSEDLNAQPSSQRGEGGALLTLTLSEPAASWTAVIVFDEDVENFAFYSWTAAVSKVEGNKVTLINRCVEVAQGRKS